MKLPRKAFTFMIALVLLAIVIAWMSGAFVSKLPTHQLDATSGPVPENTYLVEAVTDELVEEATGTITARDETTISSRLLATISKVRVRAGDTVRSGDVIIELDERDLRARVEQTSQAVRAAQAALDETQTEYNRIKELYERRVAARAEFDRIQALLISRQAELERSRQALNEANTSLSFSTISSPIDGKVIERLAEPGDTAAPGIPLLRIYNPQLLWLNANVRESLASGLNIGDQLYAFIDAIDKRLPITIDEIVPSSDPGSRSVTVKALLPTVETLYPGMFGRLLIPVGETERLYIPEDLIQRVGQLEFVNVVSNGQISRRFIRSGRHGDDGLIEVVSGLQAGETISGSEMN